MIKSCYKNQSINLIGLAHVGKAYSRNLLFLEHNRPYWRELRHLVQGYLRKYIFIYIYVFCCNLLSYKLASYPGAFAIKMYTLVYFSSKVTLLMIKSCYKNQSINLIGLAHVGKAYSRNLLFLEHNRPYWREVATSGDSLGQVYKRGY